MRLLYIMTFELKNSQNMKNGVVSVLPLGRDVRAGGHLVRGGGAKKQCELKGSEGETRIQIEGGVLLWVNPRKSCNWFLSNYKVVFGLGLNQHLICDAKLAYVHFHFSSDNIKKGPVKCFWDTKSGDIFEISSPTCKSGGSPPPTLLLRRPCLFT